MIRTLKLTAIASLMFSAGLAFAADTIKVGVTGPYTGGSSSMGVSMRDGVRLAVAEINKAGGIWDWTASVMGYAEILEAAGVPLIGQWRLAAERGDAVLLAAQIKAEENKTGRVSRKRVQRPTATQVRKLNRMRAQVRF